MRKLRKAKTPEKDLPQEKFQLLNLSDGSTVTVEQNRSFAMPAKNGDWIAVLLKAPKPDKTVEESKSEPGESFEVTPEGLKRASKETGSNKKKGS